MENNSIVLLNENMPTLTTLLLVNMPNGTTEQEAKRKAVREIMNVEAILSTRIDLTVCDPGSVVLAVKQAIADGLSLNPAAGLVYLYPQKVQIGTDSANQKVYKTVMVYDPTAEGRISIARQAGSILDHKRPECAYDHEGKVQDVTFTFMVPSYGGARWETVRFGLADFEKWKQKSASKFGSSNANYTSFKGGIDPEFAGSKAIRHALKKLGTNRDEVRKITHFHELKSEFIEASAAALKPYQQLPETHTNYEEVKALPQQPPTNEINPEDL